MVTTTARDRGLAALCILFLVSTVLITPRIYSGDEVQYFAFLRSAWKDGDLHFLNEYEWLISRAPEKQQNFKRAFVDHPNATGYARNDAPIGCAILWAPFFGLADAYVKFTGTWPADGYSFPYIFMICLGSAFYGFLGFALQYALARRWFGARSAFWAVLTLWFGAHAVYYMYVTPPMSHATSIFTTSLFLYTWFRVRESGTLRGWLLLGLVGGLAAIVRWQDAFFLVLPALDRKPLRLKLAMLAVAFLVFMPQLWAWKILNGEFNPYSTGNLKGKFFWYGKYLLPVLFSSYHGLLVWTPVVGLCLIGFVFLLRKDGVFWLLLLEFLIQFYFITCIDTWQGGAGFGLRYIISCTAIFTLALAALYEAFPRRWTPAVSILFIVWNLFMVIQVATGMIPRDGHFPVMQMVRNQFVEVPRKLGDIAYRYLFNRSSFYK